MDRTLISWNLPNWITVVLMTLGAWLFFCLVWQMGKKWRGTGSDNS